MHHDSDESCEFFDPNSHEYQPQHLAMLGLKQITIAAFGNGRRNQEPRAILSNGLLRSHDGQEDFHWSNSLVQYQYDENDASRSEVGIVLLATNAKSVMEFVNAGGHGAMLGQDGQPRTYNRTKDKMLSVLEKWQYMPFFVRPHADKLLFAPLAGFPFSEQHVCSAYLNPRSWLVLPANQVVRKLEPLLSHLGTPFRAGVFSKAPRSEEPKWLAFQGTPLGAGALGQAQGGWEKVLHITWMPDHQGDTASIHWSQVDDELIESRTLLRGGEKVQITTNGSDWDGRIGIAEGPAWPNNNVYVTNLEPVSESSSVEDPLKIRVNSLDVRYIGGGPMAPRAGATIAERAAAAAAASAASADSAAAAAAGAVPATAAD